MKKSINSFFKKHPKLSVIAVALLFGVVQVTFSFCSEVICPAFADGNFDLWNPYKKGQVNIFGNGIQKDTITINEVTRSEETTRSGGFGGGSCYTSVSISSAETGPSFQYKLSISGFSKNYAIRLFDFYIDNLNTNDSGFITAPTSPGYNGQFRFEYLRNSNFNSVLYEKLEIISRDTNNIKSAGIYKVWLAANKGVIAYEDYPGLARWIKQ